VLLRLARRSASSGAALAGGVAELADQSRHDAAHTAAAAAERARVLIAGPLGLCFSCRRLCAWALFRWWPGWPVMSCSQVCCERSAGEQAVTFVRDFALTTAGAS
jgi:hypothetical protein